MTERKVTVTEEAGDAAGASPLDHASVSEVEGLDAAPARSLGRQAWDRLRRHRLAIFSLVLLILVSMAFIFVPMFSSFGFEDIDIGNRLSGPTLEHPFGTDPLGRDLMVRTFYGGRFSLRIAIIVSLLTTTIGTLIGAVGGYLGGWVDGLLSQLTNLFLIVPALVVLIVASRYMDSPNGTALLISLLLWPSIARVVRGLFLQYRGQEFVLAARAAGAGTARIMFRHILPNTVGPIVVAATLLVGTAIILESTLGFLGLGVKPPTPTLGNLIEDAKGSLLQRPYELLVPAFFVVTITLSINFFGDALRDALDPTTRNS